MQNLKFNELIETIKSLSSEEKEEIKFLIERYLIEERREKYTRTIIKVYRN